MRLVELKKMLRDVHILASTDQPGKLNDRELDLMVQRARRCLNPQPTQVWAKLSYAEFLGVMWAIGAKLYPSMPPESAFNYLLSTQLIKSDKSYVPIPIQAEMTTLQPLLLEFQPAFAQVRIIIGSCRLFFLKR